MTCDGELLVAAGDLKHADGSIGRANGQSVTLRAESDIQDLVRRRTKHVHDLALGLILPGLLGLSLGLQAELAFF